MAYDSQPTAEEAKLASFFERDFDPIAKKVQSEFMTYRDGRRNQEEIFIRAHCNLHGVYDAKAASSITTTSRAFVQVTHPRVQTAVAMLVPVLMPPGEGVYCWTIDATPIPKMPAVMQMALAQGATAEEARLLVRQRAEKAADHRTMQVADGLAETLFQNKLMRTVLDAVAYGTGVMCGPYADIKVSEDGEETYCPEIETKSPWDIYPDPAARCVEDCMSVIDRKVMSPAQLRDLRKRQGFNSEIIDEMLKRFGTAGNWVAEPWEQSIRVANGSNTTTSTTGRYCVLVRWGYLTGADAKTCGMTVPESLLEEQIMCQVWVLDNKVIYAANSELHRDRIPFYFVPYTITPHSIWGRGVPEMMADSQDAVNAIERSKMDNAALSSRPQVIVNPSLLVPGHNHLEIKAGKIWPVQMSEVPGYKPVEFFVPDCRLDQLERVQQDAMAFIQEQTAIPNFLMGMGGQGTHNRTAEGASLQFNTAVTPMKSVVFNFENYLVVPLITKMAKFYEMYGDDPEANGDYKIHARGLQGLMSREATVGKLMQFMQVVGTVPGWAEQVDLGRVFELLVRSEGLADEGVTLTPEQLQKKQQEQAQQQAVNEQAGLEAKAQLEQKTRAETAPKDAALELLKRSGEGPLKFATMQMVAEMFGIANPALDEAIQKQEAIDGYKLQADVAEHGARMAEAVHGSEMLQRGEKEDTEDEDTED